MRSLLPSYCLIWLYVQTSFFPHATGISVWSSLESSVSLCVDSLKYRVCILRLWTIWRFCCVEHETGILLPLSLCLCFQFPATSMLGVMILRALRGLNYPDKPHLRLPQHTQYLLPQDLHVSSGWGQLGSVWFILYISLYLVLHFAVLAYWLAFLDGFWMYAAGSFVSGSLS